MAGPLDEIDGRLGWARQHIHQLEEQVRDLLAGGPLYEVRSEPQPDGLTYEIRAHRLKPIPREIGFEVADAIHNLRACLDNIAWAVVSSYGTPDPRTEFPVTLRPSGFRRCKDAFFADVPQEAIDIIEAHQPYKGSDWREHWLRLLNSRWNGDKHRVPIIAAAMPGMGSYLIADEPVVDYWVITDVATDEDVVVGGFRFAAPYHASFQTGFSFEICIKERGRSLGRTLPGALLAHHGAVGHVLAQLRPYIQ